jgi:hypothetical protein
MDYFGGVLAKLLGKLRLVLLIQYKKLALQF